MNPHTGLWGEKWVLTHSNLISTECSTWVNVESWSSSVVALYQGSSGWIWAGNVEFVITNGLSRRVREHMQWEDKAFPGALLLLLQWVSSHEVPRSLPDNLSPSDASITMAAPQLQEALHQLQQIIIRGTMKCPRHWQLICLWQSNISTREIKPCVASQAEVLGKGKSVKILHAFRDLSVQNTPFCLLCSSAIILYHIDVQMGGSWAISTSSFVSDTEAEWNRGLTASIEVMFLLRKWAVWDLLFAVWVCRCLWVKVISCQFNK